MLLVICGWGVHTEHKAVYHRLISTNGLFTQSIYCLALKVTGQEMELCHFSMKSREKPDYFEWLFSLFNTFEVWVLFDFLLWENFCSLLQSCLLSCLHQGCDPEQTRGAFYVLEHLRFVLHVVSACRHQGVLGLESDFAPRQSRRRCKSLVGMLGGWWPPICPPNLAAFVLMLVTCRGTLPEGGTPDPLTYVLGCVEPPQYHPKGAGIACCVGADTSGLAGSWEKFSCRRVEQSLPRLIPYAGNPRGAHLCVFPKLGFELCMGPSFPLACMLSGRALAGAWWHHPSNAWAEWRQRHSQMLSVTSLRDEAQLFLEGRVSHCRGKSSSAPCPHCQWTSLILFLIQCYRGKW